MRLAVASVKSTRLAARCLVGLCWTVWDSSDMPDYQRDPDIRAILETGFAIPDGLDAAEVERLRTFLSCDQELERFYAVSQPRQRAPAPVLVAVASAAMAAYDQRSDRLPVGW